MFFSGYLSRSGIAALFRSLMKSSDFNLIRNGLPFFFLPCVTYMFDIISKNSLPNLRAKEFMPKFSSESLIGLALLHTLIIQIHTEIEESRENH